MTPTYSVCLDIGSEQDFSVFTILRIMEHKIANPAEPVDDTGLPHYGLVFLEQMPLKTRYPVIIDRAGAIIRSLRGNCHFLVDASGAGNPVVQMMQELNPIPIFIVGGTIVNARESGGYNVPKREIVTSLQSIMHAGRLQIASGLPHLDQLRNQILGFKMKQRDSGVQAFEAATERTHDDIVMSLAVNVWYLERLYGYKISASTVLPEVEYDPFEAYS